MNYNKIFNYQGQNITFQFKDNNKNIMINATQMAKQYNKRPIDWLRLSSAKQFIDSISAVRKSHSSELVIKLNGVGTWLNEDIALEFARWLNPEFAIWCNYRTKELLKYGFTATSQTIENIIQNPDLIINLATKLKEERQENKIKQEQLLIAKNTIKQQAPKVEYYDTCLQSNSLISTTIVAQQLEITAIKLNKLLVQKDIIYKVNSTFTLKEKYNNMGLAKYKTHSFYDNNGTIQTKKHLYWTEKGNKFILDLLK